MSSASNNAESTTANRQTQVRRERRARVASCRAQSRHGSSAQDGEAKTASSAASDSAGATPSDNPQDHANTQSAFSALTLARPLHPYQGEVAGHILRSIFCGLGLTFTVMMARQMGKNELSAHLQAFLLSHFARTGGSIVKAAPTFRPQITTSLMRLEHLLRRPGFNHKWKREHGYTIAVGDARALFFSAEPESSVMGATASLMLEIDEAQDIEPDKYTRDFRPMASSTNATTVLWGTAWTDDSLLEATRQTNLRLQQKDTVPRHFEFDWTHGAAVNDRYGKFVRAEKDRLGESHPLIRTQYLLLPLKDAGAFFTRDQLGLLHGEHERQRVPSPVSPEPFVTDPSFYVAAVDVAGPSELSVDHLLRAANPRKDSTVVTIARVTPLGDREEPFVHILDLYWWTGRPLHEQCESLSHLLNHVWPCRKVVVDASGLGADLAARLQLALGEHVVEPFIFTAPSKSKLAYHLLARVNAGRLQMWSEEFPSPEAEEFWKQLRLARPIHRISGLLSFFVPDHLGHDDFLSSLALLSWTIQPQSMLRKTPIVPTQFIYPEPEDVNSLPF